MSTLSGANSPGKKRKAVSVALLNGEQYIVYVDVKSKFQDVFNQVANYLTLRETEYFGLAFMKDGEYHFVSNEEKVSKHAPKQWKTGPGEGYDGHGKPLLTLYFRVQFYVDQVVLLREKVTRHLYYLQLKDNVLNYHHGCLEEKCFLVAAYALQADFGDYHTAAATGEYFDPREYFPAWMVEKHGSAYLVENTPVVHRDLHSLPRSEAEWRFIKETSVSPAAHNLHFYRLKKKKTDKIFNAWLGICARGIEMYEDLDDGFKDLISTFLWPDIGKLTFDKKKFEIRSVGAPAGRKFTYYTESDVKSKFLLTLSRNTHMFQMAIQPKLMEIRHLEEEDKRRYRESYIYSDPRDLVTNGPYRSNISPRSKTAMGNRYSVISNASSNTTSGIASDKMTVSFEDSDDVGREIMIDAPPISSMLLSTPSQTRSRIVSTLPGYKPSPVPGANRSPVLENKDVYTAYTFPSSNRTPVLQPHFQPANKKQSSTGSIQSDHSGSGGQSEGLSLSWGSGSSGSYRRRMKQQQHGLYSPVSPVMPVYANSSEVVREKTSRPASRSASRKESFKEILAQLQVRSPELPPPQPHLIPTPQLKHVPSFHMEDLKHRSGSRSGSSDHQTNQSNASDLSGQSLLASNSTVTSLGDHQQPNLSYGSAASFGSDNIKLQEAEELLMPPAMFVDEKSLSDIPAEQLHVQSQTVTEQALSELPANNEEPVKAADLQVTDEETDDSGAGVAGKKGKPTHITVMNQKEVLHPEIEEIRGQPHAFSLPFITALCNDKSLLPSASNNSGSVLGSYDMSSIRSTDSRISRISYDTDNRRLSVSYPSGSNTMMSSNRPFSWHSESFDLDAQLANLNVSVGQPVTENHRSVPQNLSDFTSPGASAWTHAVAYGTPFRQNMDRYSPELISTQHMIPPRLSSGGHNSTEGNMGHKSLLKENVGIA